MRNRLWDFSATTIDLEDLDVSVDFLHPKSLASVTVKFRVDASALEGRARDLKDRIELIAREHLLSLAASLQNNGELIPSD